MSDSEKLLQNFNFQVAFHLPNHSVPLNPSIKLSNINPKALDVELRRGG